MALRQMQNQYKEKGITWETFLRKLDEVHGVSLNWFYQQWFERTGAPAWTSSWKAMKGELTLTLHQQDSLYRLPLTILIQYTDGTTARKVVWLQHETDVFRLAAHHPVNNVVVDPDFHVLHWTEDLTPVAYELSKAQKVLMLIYQQKLNEAEQLARSYLSENTLSDPYGLQFTLWSLIGRIKSIEEKNDEALEAYENAVQCVTRPPELLARTYYKIAGLAARKGDKTLVRQAAANAVYADTLNGGIEGMAKKVKPLL
jgi:aminopeptidase N